MDACPGDWGNHEVGGKAVLHNLSLPAPSLPREYTYSRTIGRPSQGAARLGDSGNI